MSRLAVLLAGVASLALVTAGFGLWRADRPVDGAPAATTSAFRDTQPVATFAASRSDVVRQETKTDATATHGAAFENGSVDDYSVPPSTEDDAELQAAFEELLNDPDPEIRREAAQLAQEFGVMGDE